MLKFRALILIAAFVTPCRSTFACSIVFPPPEGMFKESQAVVLAIPKGISYLPKEAAKRDYEGPYRQTVLWQVLVSWKGKYRAGYKFTTRQSFGGEISCSTSSPINPNRLQLLYLQGREPYANFFNFDPGHSVKEFKHLETVKSR